MNPFYDFYVFLDKIDKKRFRLNFPKKEEHFKSNLSLNINSFKITTKKILNSNGVFYNDKEVAQLTDAMYRISELFIRNIKTISA